MKLIKELTEDVQYIKEGDVDSAEKSYFIEGIIMQGEIKNRNGRYYPKRQKGITTFTSRKTALMAN
jgi:hypothetical protein